MADSDPLSNFLGKFQQELKDNDIRSLASGFSLRDGATKADVMGELQNQVKMNAESLETFIKKLREMTLNPNHIQRVIDFKDRHFETFSSESWRESERSSESDYTHGQSFPAPIDQSQSGDEA